MAKSTFKPGIFSNDFTLFAGSVQNAFDDFVNRLNQEAQRRIATGLSPDEAMAQIDADFRNNGPLLRRLTGDIGQAVDFGANTTFQRTSNPVPKITKGKGAPLFEWTLDPAAEHCESCLHQASLPPRSFDDIPLPTQQPTHGDSNCREYCKCTLTPVGNAGGAGPRSAPPPIKTPTPAPPAKPRAPKPPKADTTTGLKPPAPVQVDTDWFARLKDDSGSIAGRMMAKVPDVNVNAVRDGLAKSAGAYGAKLDSIGPMIGRSTANGTYEPVGSGHLTGNGRPGRVEMNAVYLREPDAVIKKVQENFAELSAYVKGDLTNDLQIAVARGDKARQSNVRSLLERNAETKRWSISSVAPNGTQAIARTATHEGFHAVYFQNPGIPEAWRAALVRNGCVKPWTVSDYAATADYETFTEVGAAIAHGVDIPDNYRKAFMETLALIG
jgi:hypothetical protein